MAQRPVQKPTLCLHVGYGKTGSTAIQAWLLSQRSALEAAGVAYPIPKEGVGDSGNGSLLVEALAQPTEKPWWLEELQPGIQGVLFSREHLARELSQPHCCDLLADFAQRWGFGSIRILLFVRDPREHCYSLWAQKVKRAGECRSLATFAAAYDGISMISSFIKAAVAAQCYLRVLDYGQHRHALLYSVAEWLSIVLPGVGDLPTHLSVPLSTQNIINLTPSRSQLRLKRYINRFWLGAKPPLPSKKIANFILRFSPAQSFISDSIFKEWNTQSLSLRSVKSIFIEFVDPFPLGSSH